jgi:hypothetical protein
MIAWGVEVRGSDARLKNKVANALRIAGIGDARVDDAEANVSNDPKAAVEIIIGHATDK